MAGLRLQPGPPPARHETRGGGKQDITAIYRDVCPWKDEAYRLQQLEKVINEQRARTRSAVKVRVYKDDGKVWLEDIPA